MRIAQVAPLYERVPPLFYGGTERVVSYLTEELVRLGHDVTLFASGDSITRARLRASCAHALRLDQSCRDPLAPHVRMLGQVYRHAHEFDVIHCHTDYLGLPLSATSPTPTIITLHGRLDIPEIAPLYSDYPEVPLVSISDAQRIHLPHANWAATVHHGLPSAMFPFCASPGKYLLFVGRISAEKRPDSAIQIARRAQLPLRIAAKVDGVDRIGDDYYLLASALAPRRSRQLLNYGDSFAIFDLAGDIPLAGREPYGLFHGGTRFLDRFELRLNGKLPILLSSAPTDDSSEIVTYLSNADEHRNGELVLQRDTVAIQRSKTLHANALYECLHLHNYGQEPLTLKLSVLFGSDFADVFTLRGVDRKRRGALNVAVAEAQTARLTYRGLDGVIRQTEMAFSPGEWRVEAGSAMLEVRLAPGQDSIAEICVRCAASAMPRLCSIASLRPLQRCMPEDGGEPGDTGIHVRSPSAVGA